jgi:hypothetical protein
MTLPRVVVTRAIVGIVSMQVCAVSDATDEEILAVCNRENPSGTSQGWTSVVREGAGAPVTCHDDPARQHLLVSC